MPKGGGRLNKYFFAKRYALIFLDHGGRLDDVCLDQWPDASGSDRWLSSRLAGSIIRTFNKSVSGSAELLFLQQCGRGAIENLYSFRDAAEVVMASQTTVGAPNTYYESTFRWLADTNGQNGIELARAIAERDEHFIDYVIVSGEPIGQLPERLAPVLALMREGHQNLRDIFEQLAPTFSYDGDTFYDLIQSLRQIVSQSGLNANSLDELESWLRVELILAHIIHPAAYLEVRAWSGLSWWVPRSESSLATYRELPFCLDSSVDELWGSLRPWY